MKISMWAALVAMTAVSGWASSGQADLSGTAANSPIHGTVRFEDTPGGLLVNAQLVGVPAGAHGFHIHEFGSCENVGKAAGGHFNPAGHNHGDVTKAGAQGVHPGDMGNITAQANGSATLKLTIPGVSLSSGPFNVAGRAVVLHEKADDLTSQPAGNAGERIACGPILVVSPSGK